MSRYSIVWFLSIVLFFTGCSTKEPLLPNQKAFEQEDELIIKALYANDIGDTESSINTFYELYIKSARKIYLKEATRLSLLSKKIDSKKLIDEAIKKYPEDTFFKKILISYHTSKKEYEIAEEILIPILQKEPTIMNYKIAAGIYLGLKKYEFALKYLQKSYLLSNDEDDLNQISYILFEVLDKKNQAISYLESHIALQGASARLYYRLIGYYGAMQNVDGIISTYKKLYLVLPSDDVANKIIELYAYKKDIDSAIDFLEESKHNYKALFDLYASIKEYKKIVKLADKLYSENGNIEMQGYATIYFYEANKDNLSSKVLKEVQSRFEALLKRSNDAMYLNYYGYLLIDHEIDVKKGVGLVKKALLSEPQSLSYLDSLAWGYYKLGECEKAYEILSDLKQKTTEQEILIHYNEVKKCKDNKR